MATVQDYLDNANWVKKVEQTFVVSDVNKNGYVSREDFMLGIDKLAAKITDRPELMAKAREVTEEYATAMGLTEGVKADKQLYLELAAKMALAETARAKKGEMTLIEKVENATFDLIDTNRDGVLVWKEYEQLTSCSNMEPEALKAAFNFLDKSGDGKISRKEFMAADVQFWTTLDTSNQDMYGENYKA